MIALIIVSLVCNGLLALAVVHIYSRQRALEIYVRGVAGFLSGAASGIASEIQSFKKSIIAGVVLGALTTLISADKTKNPQP
jgi:arginine repressor